MTREEVFFVVFDQSPDECFPPLRYDLNMMLFALRQWPEMCMVERRNDAGEKEVELELGPSTCRCGVDRRDEPHASNE